jgi:hypothetical protein
MSEELSSSRVSSGATPDAPDQPGGPEKPAEQLARRVEPGQLEQRRQQKQMNRSAHRELGRRRERSRPPEAGGAEDLPAPSCDAYLHIEADPVNVEVSARGPLALGIVGPAATVAVGHLAGFPVWAILTICALQIVAAVVMSRRVSA